jgi:Uma2 family endonuclease
MAGTGKRAKGHDPTVYPEEDSIRPGTFGPSAGRKRRTRDYDPTVYPEEERLGEEILQRWIVELLRPLLESWLNERGTYFVGADQFIYYRQYDPHQRYAPDVYVLEGVRPTTRVRSWKTWETGLAPLFALEIVSQDWRKDYAEAPERAAAAGISELAVFDPSWAERPGGVGSRWQIFRPAKRGPLRRIEATNEDRVRSRTLRCWLRTVGVGDAIRIRLGVGPRGDLLLPTALEAEQAAREKEQAAREKEQAAKQAALARVAELEALLRARSPKKKR